MSVTEPQGGTSRTQSCVWLLQKPNFKLIGCLWRIRSCVYGVYRQIMIGARSMGASLLTIDAGFPFPFTFGSFEQQQKKEPHLWHISLLWKTRKMSKQKKSGADAGNAGTAERARSLGYSLSSHRDMQGPPCHRDGPQIIGSFWGGFAAILPAWGTMDSSSGYSAQGHLECLGFINSIAMQC